jgi:hypothetical protein
MGESSANLFFDEGLEYGSLREGLAASFSGGSSRAKRKRRLTTTPAGPNTLYWLLGSMNLMPQNSGFDVPGIINLVNQELLDPDCAKFAATILNQLSKGKGGSLADVFKAFLNQPKAHELYTRVRPSGSLGEATTIGSLKNSTAAMFLRPTTPAEQTLRDANNTIGELFHPAGGSYSDEQLAKALRVTPYASEASLAFPDGTANIFDKKNYLANGWSDADGYSHYFHAIQLRHCGTIPANTYKNKPIVRKK